MQDQPIRKVINLLDPSRNILLHGTLAEAEASVASGDPARVREISGQFAIAQQVGNFVRLARSIGRPMRYFLAKQAAGPLLIIAERMDEIRQCLAEHGLGDQFHPSYTRMVPAHYLVELAVIGCPDPNPHCTRFFTPTRNQLSTNLDDIGQAYIGAVAEACDAWLERIDPQAPLGVMFSGGVDSGALLLILNHLLLRRGQSPARLKAFTLSVGGSGSDAEQAVRFCAETDLSMLLEVIDVPAAAIDWRQAVRVIEDYKPLDVQAAAMGWALCQGIRERYPDWRYLIDGDGGDENLKDYPIEDNPELTIRSVLNNPLLYHEGWGVFAVKHSLTYSGGQSRGHVRTYAPAAQLGFTGFSPYALPSVIAVSEGIPFIELTNWSHEKLYALKGEIVRRGVEWLTGRTMPVFEKCRFQQGAIGSNQFAEQFPTDEWAYRRELLSQG